MTPEDLRKKRPYVLVGAFVIGTPPDVFSQTLLAIPMYLLFEIGVLLLPILCRYKDVAATEKKTETLSKRIQAGVTPKQNENHIFSL